MPGENPRKHGENMQTPHVLPVVGMYLLLWEETGGPGENPRRHGEIMQTPHVLPVTDELGFGGRVVTKLKQTGEKRSAVRYMQRVIGVDLAQVVRLV